MTIDRIQYTMHIRLHVNNQEIAQAWLKEHGFPPGVGVHEFATSYHVCSSRPIGPCITCHHWQLTEEFGKSFPACNALNDTIMSSEAAFFSPDDPAEFGCWLWTEQLPKKENP